MEQLSYGRYKVLELLGEGAMGRVYLSEDPILKRQVAVKVISTDRHLDPAVLKEYLERFSIEAQACAKLNHQTIVSIYDAGEENGVPWIAFEYVNGERLDRLIAQKKPLSFEKVASIAGDISQAMHHAHSMNIVHRDIKPANILIDSNTQIAKLADFGVVKSPFTTLTQSGTSMGSPGYMSPEQIDGTDVDCRSDIFSFGITLYEMITGTHPFLRDSVQTTFFATVNCNYTPVKKLREDTPEKLVRILERCLVANRNGRVKTSQEVCALLAGCIEDATRKTKLKSIKNAEGFITAWFQNFRFLICKKTREGWTVLLPFYRSKSIELRRFYNDKILPTAKDAFYKVYNQLSNRFSKTQITAGLAGITGLFALVVVIMLFSTAKNKNSSQANFQKAALAHGYAVTNNNALIDSCKNQILRGDFGKANNLADILTLSKKHAVYGQLFRTMTALSVDKFEEAYDRLWELKRLGGANNIIRKEHPFLIQYLEPRIYRKLPDDMVDIYASKFYLNENSQIKAWTASEHYWQRWNAARILKKAGERVDVVPLYILDLHHSGSNETKINAAKKLGELRDKRAIPELLEVRDGRGAVSSTARMVLREKFNVK
ncbi:MAG: protein kinase [Chitinispirillales bacterium]|jgi:tRNA A-37 threonylcarbamoyl transferase component Bud32|nr:protein kinase [Chitinispirillales bacterium]